MSEGLVLLYGISLFYPLHSDQPAPSTEAVPAATVQHIPALVQKYIDYLKDRYKAHRISPMLKEGVKIRPKQFIHLNMVSNEEEEEDKSKSHLLQLYGDVAAIKKKRRPMEMEDIGRREDQSVAQHILVEGSPGIGKTMFSWELCRQWAEGKMLQDRDIILMLQLRSKRVREAKSLSDLFYHDNDSIKQEVLEHITSVDGRGVFLVLEGYDELTEDQRTEGSILNRLLTGDCLSKASIMVTSRLLANDSLCPEFIDQHIEVVGFNDEDIKSYVEMACQKQPKILPDLISYIASNSFVSSIMYIPLQCATLTALYIEKWRANKGKAYAPTTLTQLYTDLLLSSLIRYISDHQEYSKCKTKIRQLSDLPSEVQEQVWKLSQIAAEGLENRQFIFDSIPCDHMGLMQSSEEELVIGCSMSYCFLHLTLQEHLAALHWSRMGSEDMVRLVSETSLFPLDTLVRDGITEASNYHWTALYFLSGLTKHSSNLFELLNASLKAADNMADDDVQNRKIIQKMKYLVDMSMSSLSSGKKCNPYFFQVLFEAQSPDFNSKLFHEVSVTTTINNPLECFVTAWCVANSDPTSQWKCIFKDILMLENFVNNFKLFCSSPKASSVVLVVLTCKDKLLISQQASEELGQSFPSVFSHLEFLGFVTTPASLPQITPLLCSIQKLTNLKMLHIKTKQGIEDELPAVLNSIQPTICPSLRNIFLEGGPHVGKLFVRSLVLPNIDNLTVIMLKDCQILSGPDFSRFCGCLSESTSLQCLIVWGSVNLNAKDWIVLVSALEQISTLRIASFNNTSILTDVGLHHMKQNAISLQEYSEKDVNDRIKQARNKCRPIRSLIADHEFVQNPVIEDIIPFLSLKTEDSGDGRKERKRGLQVSELSDVKKRAMQSDEQQEEN